MLLKSLFKSKGYMLFALFFVCCFVSSGQGEKKTEAKRDGLKGRVKTVEQFVFNGVMKFGKLEKGNLARKRTYQYDAKGSTIEVKSYYSNGSLEYKYIPKYDDEGNKSEVRSYKSSGRLAHKYTPKYDEQGHRIEWALYHPDGSLFCKYNYKYDEHDNQIEKLRYHSDGSLDWKYTYQYNDHGDLMEWSEYASDGVSLKNKYSYEYAKYDAEGNWIARIEFIAIDGEVKKATEITERKITYY